MAGGELLQRYNWVATAAMRRADEQGDTALSDCLYQQEDLLRRLHEAEPSERSALNDALVAMQEDNPELYDKALATRRAVASEYLAAMTIPEPRQLINN